MYNMTGRLWVLRRLLLFFVVFSLCSKSAPLGTISINGCGATTENEKRNVCACQRVLHQKPRRTNNIFQCRFKTEDMKSARRKETGLIMTIECCLGFQYPVVPLKCPEIDVFEQYWNTLNILDKLKIITTKPKYISIMSINVNHFYNVFFRREYTCLTVMTKFSSKL